MERQKLLLVILSVSLLLVVVLAGGLYFFRPPAADARIEDSEVSSLANVDFDPFEYVQGDQEPPPLEPAPETAGELQIYVGIEAEDTPVVEQPTSAQQVQRPSPSRPQAAPQPAAPKPAAKSSPPPRTTPREITVEEYWIQAGSYRSRTRAEDFSKHLAQVGLIGRITTRTVGSETYFRVRIGPFQSKQEAEKFLAWMKDIEGLQDSYVSVVYRKASR